MGGSLSILGLRRGKFHLHSYSLSSLLSKVPPVFVLQSFHHFHPFLGKLHSFPWEKRIPEYFGLFIWIQMKACRNPGLTSFEAEACGCHDSGVLDSAPGRSHHLEKLRNPCKPQPPWHQGLCWTAGLLAMPCCSNCGNSWRKHFLGGLNRLPAFFP